MTLEIHRLSDALGAEVTGLAFDQPLDAAAIDALRAAFLEHHLLCLRGPPLPAADFARIGGYFGEPQLQLLRDKWHGEVPEVSILESTYKAPQDKPDDLRLVRLSSWHTDDSYFETPAKATMLQSIAIPSAGGQTRFCNTQKAYEDLPEPMQRELDGKHAVHGYDTSRAPGQAAALTVEEDRQTGEVVHPLVRTNEDTGRQALYYNANRTDRIEGLDRADSDALLDRIGAQITQPCYRYDHDWRLGDLLVWDNRCLVHSVNMDFPVGERRLHQRILLKGSRPA